MDADSSIYSSLDKWAAWWHSLKCVLIWCLCTLDEHSKHFLLQSSFAHSHTHSYKHFFLYISLLSNIHTHSNWLEATGGSGSCPRILRHADWRTWRIDPLTRTTSWATAFPTVVTAVASQQGVQIQPGVFLCRMCMFTHVSAHSLRVLQLPATVQTCMGLDLLVILNWP